VAALGLAEMSGTFRTKKGSATWPSPIVKSGWRWLPPEILEPVRRQFGVLDRVLNVAVPEIHLQRPCIPAVVRQLIASRMAQHVRVRFEPEPGRLAGPLYHLRKAAPRERRAALGHEYEFRVRRLFAQPAQRSHGVAL
jgi:hypothetical protein